jgi:hypothetical protein
MSRGTCLSLPLLIAASCLPALVSADGLDDALRRCAGLSNQTQRLDCFDTIVSTLPQAEADRFGMTVGIELMRDHHANQQATDAVLEGKIAELWQAPRGEWAFTLENRQVWIEVELRPNIEFTVGEDVHIEHGAMSSLWLVADRNRRVRVKRLR